MAKVLVIEDEASIREEVMDWLRFEGHQVSGAANGRLGLESLKQSVPDLIISDIAMPEMDGYELLLELRSNPAYMHIPFIFLTASAERTSIRRGMDIGADDYLTKPFSHAEVMNAIQARLAQQLKHHAQSQGQIDELASALNEERERLLLKSRLVAMFSHDFRNPLSSILSSSNILRTYSERLSPERKQQHFDRIDGAVHLLIQMLDQMLTVAQMENSQMQYRPQSVNIVLLIESLVDECRLIYADHRFSLEVMGEWPSNGLVDPLLLRQIASNLISNAAKYSPKDSLIRVRLLADPETNGFELHVIDHGTGISEDEQPHLFVAFYRAKSATGTKGTGLGLAIVKEAVGICGGDISIKSVLGQGTTFEVAFPHSLMTSS